MRLPPATGVLGREILEEGGQLHPLSAGQADDPLPSFQVPAAVAEDAGELGCTGHEALEVHPQTAVPVAAREGLGQLVVQVETCRIQRQPQLVGVHGSRGVLVKLVECGLPLQEMAPELLEVVQGEALSVPKTAQQLLTGPEPDLSRGLGVGPGRLQGNA